MNKMNKPHFLNGGKPFALILLTHLLLLLLLFYFFRSIDFFEWVYTSTRSTEAWDIDEIILILLLAPLLIWSTKHILKFINQTLIKRELIANIDSNPIERKVNESFFHEVNSLEEIDKELVILDESEIEKLTINLCNQEGQARYNEEELHIILNWANRVRLEENLLNLVLNKKLNVGVKNSTVKFTI